MAQKVLVDGSSLMETTDSRSSLSTKGILMVTLQWDRLEKMMDDSNSWLGMELPSHLVLFHHHSLVHMNQSPRHLYLLFRYQSNLSPLYSTSLFRNE